MIYKSKLYRKVHIAAVAHIERCIDRQKTGESMPLVIGIEAAFREKGCDNPPRVSGERTMDYVIRCAVALGFDADGMVRKHEERIARKKANANSRKAMFEQRMSTPIRTSPDGTLAFMTPTDEQKRQFYASWEWREMRMRALKKYGRRCSCCGASPQDTDLAGNPVKIVVDHIKPISRYWDLRFDEDGLQILCDECNQGKSNKSLDDWRDEISSSPN